jgi:transposase
MTHHTILNQHYGQLLGLCAPWIVVKVDLDLAAKRVIIRLDRDKSFEMTCPECGRSCPIYDSVEERQWRHLDTMQFETILVATVPRVDCPEHGVRRGSVPWARPHGRFTLLFEAFAISVLECCGTVKAAAEILRVNWKTLDGIMKAAVERGMDRRELVDVTRISLDEKHYSKKEGCVSVMCDIDGSRVLDLVPKNSEAAATALLETLPDDTQGMIEAVTMDMCPSFKNATTVVLPWADVVHDRFHVKKALNEATDTVRRQESKDNPLLKRTRHLWLYNYANLKEHQRQRFAVLKKENLTTAKAYSIKEMFDEFWNAPDAEVAAIWAERWLSWALNCRIEPMVRIAKTIQKHLDCLLTYFEHRVTNAIAEGMNSKIQTIIAAARGLRSFVTLRIRVLFFCGNLELSPVTH